MKKAPDRCYDIRIRGRRARIGNELFDFFRRPMVGLFAALILLPAPAPAVLAQDTFNCDDFDSQFAAQTELNRTFPEDPSGLDADNDWIACEDFFELTDDEEASVVPADAVNRATVQDEAEALDGPVPVPLPTPSPAPAPLPAEEPGIPETGGVTGDVTADVMARVAGCAVIAISSRGVAAAGCPGVGVITYRIPRDAPSLNGTVIIDPRARTRPTERASEQSAATQSTTGGRGAAPRGKAQREQAAIEKAREASPETAPRERHRKHRNGRRGR